MTEEFIKSVLDGRLWWVDDFGTTRVKSVPVDFIPTHERMFGSVSNEPRVSVPKPRRDRDKPKPVEVPVLGTHPATVPMAERIILTCARLMNVPRAMMSTHNRDPDAVRARHIAYYVVRVCTGLSFPQMGKVFERDHATIQHGVWKVQQNPAYYEPELSEAMNQFKKEAA